MVGATRLLHCTFDTHTQWFGWIWVSHDIWKSFDRTHMFSRLCVFVCALMGNGHHVFLRSLRENSCMLQVDFLVVGWLWRWVGGNYIRASSSLPLILAPGDVAHLHITSHHISSTSQKWSKSEKSQNPSGIADRASGSILEPPEGPKYDFWHQILKIVKIKK